MYFNRRLKSLGLSGTCLLVLLLIFFPLLVSGSYAPHVRDARMEGDTLLIILVNGYDSSGIDLINTEADPQITDEFGTFDDYDDWYTDNSCYSLIDPESGDLQREGYDIFSCDLSGISIESNNKFWLCVLGGSRHNGNIHVLQVIDVTDVIVEHHVYHISNWNYVPIIGLLIVLLLVVFLIVISLFVIILVIHIKRARKSRA